MKTKVIITIMTILLLSSIALSITLAAPVLLTKGKRQLQWRGDYVADHALFDTTGGDHGAKAKCLDRIFEFYLVARAVGGPATIRITFADGDWIEFPLKAADDSISFTQAAGGTLGVDDELNVEVVSGNAVGWISIRAQKGAKADPKPPYSGSFCITW